MLQILGGVLIGVAASLMLLFSGRVTGISGIIGSVLNQKNPEKSWRFLFLLGLFVGGVVIHLIRPGAFSILTKVTAIDYVLAGLLVGFGTLLGNGCTSGHGVCGISRFSIRSVVATIVFISSGALSVALFRLIRGGL